MNFMFVKFRVCNSFVLLNTANKRCKYSVRPPAAAKMQVIASTSSLLR